MHSGSHRVSLLTYLPFVEHIADYAEWQLQTKVLAQ